MFCCEKEKSEIPLSACKGDFDLAAEVCENTSTYEITSTYENTNWLHEITNIRMGI